MSQLFLHLLFFSKFLWTATVQHLRKATLYFLFRNRNSCWRGMVTFLHHPLYPQMLNPSDTCHAHPPRVVSPDLPARVPEGDGAGASVLADPLEGPHQVRLAVAPALLCGAWSINIGKAACRLSFVVLYSDETAFFSLSNRSCKVQVLL